MKKIITTIIVLLALSFTLKAQQGLYDYKDFTPYEKQRSDLAGEAGKKVYDALSDSDKLTFSMTMLTAANNAKNDYEIMIGIEDALCAMFGVASLTNPEQATSYYEYRMTNQMKTIAKWYFDERAKIEKQKTKLDIEREKERLTGFYAIKQDIKSAFLIWSTKGTYEKQADYVTRLQKNAKTAFDSICYKLCTKQYFDNIKIETVGYNVDNEMYSIKTYYVVNKQETGTVTLQTKMQVEVAKEYKFPYFVRDEVVPVNLYYHDGLLLSNKLLDVENNYHFENSFDSNEPLEIPYNILNISNEDLYSVMNGYIFNYEKHVGKLILVYDSINNRKAILKKKIEELEASVGKNGPWGSYGPYGSFTDLYHNYNLIKEPWRIKNHTAKINEYEQTCVLYIKDSFYAYRPLFDSDDDFIAFFFNEKGVDINALEQLIKQKFDSFVSTIGDAKELKKSNGTPIGNKMLEFCAMSKVTQGYRLMGIRVRNVILDSDYVENMLKDYILKNKVLKKKFDSPYDSDSKHASYVIARYVIEGK